MSMAGNMDRSLLINEEIAELTVDFSFTSEASGLENSVNFKFQNDKSGIPPVSPKTLSDESNPIPKSNFNCKEYYYNVIKPQCPNLEYSYSELFSDNKGPGFAKEFVAKRIAAAIDKMKKSQSLLTLNEPQHKNDLNTAFVNTSNVHRSLECLNETFSKNLGTTLNTSLPKDNNDSYVTTECHKLRKSFSFSGYSNLNKNESLIDMEMELEDSVPSEDEKDEMGLPVRKFLFCGTPSKNKHDITQTIQKYKKILRETFGEPNNDVNNFAEEEAVPAPTYVNQPASSLSDVQDVHLKKTSSKAAGKGPLKALMPLQNMTKQVGALLSSPFKKKKVKTVNGPNKDSSHILDDSNFYDSQPMAVSTPTSGSKGSRDESTGSKNRTFRRSSSENTLYTSNIKSSITSQMSAANNTRAISNAEKTSVKSAPVKNAKQSIASTSKTVSSSGLRRPSTAPVSSIKAPLTSKLSININQNFKLNGIKPPSSTLNTNRKVSTSQRISNTTCTIKSSGSSDKKALVTSRPKKPSLQYINKENI